MRCRQTITAVTATLCVLGLAGNRAAAQGPLDAEAIVVGAGPSGLAAAVEMGRAGVNVLVLDMNSVMGERTLPGETQYMLIPCLLRPRAPPSVNWVMAALAAQ